jgi:hypothetical protein
MHKKRRYVLVLIPLAAVWLYAVGQSAGRMFALIDGAPRALVERPAVAPPYWVHEPMAPQRDIAVTPAVVPAAERRTAAEPWSPPAPVYAEPSYSQAPSAEPIEHPEITDPHLRRLLQPAWDD